MTRRPNDTESCATAAPPLKVWTERAGALLRLRLDRPKANLVDLETAEAIHDALGAHIGDSGLLAVLVDHAGPHFSYGASIPEHLPDRYRAMLDGMHRMVLAMVDYPLPILVAVRGFCLGGGLELASAGHLLFAAPDSELGQPEIKLAVFAPAASCLLPELIGQARADDLLFSGRTVTGAEAQAMGLVAAVADDPEAAALAYFDQHLGGLSAPALRCAVQASRMGYAQRIREKLARMEELYVDDLMAKLDPVEGLTAFMEKRPPRWRHR
ncbi:MAG: cyclohexa-1,5-dienecarbonyl-CoA hydratase [Alphaproteobacteria bacterium]|nr:cyclohexa-1,5-dienecarbonyl-CoA hydratase [Alphaproteobacteria bacterium]